MRVPVEEKITDRQAARRDVNQIKEVTSTFEQKRFRQVEPVIIIAKHSVKRASEGEAGAERFQSAEIPKMPNFIGLAQGGQDFLRKGAVRVGDDRDEQWVHGCFWWESLGRLKKKPEHLISVSFLKRAHRRAFAPESRRGG